MNFNPYYSNYLENLSSDRSFNYRKSVNILSLIIILITFLNIVPSEISALGISLEGTEQKQLVGILLFVDIYLFIAFSIRTYIDYQRHLSILTEKRFEHIIEMMVWLETQIGQFDSVVEAEKNIRASNKGIEKFLESGRTIEGLQKYIEDHGFQIGESEFNDFKEMRIYLQNLAERKKEINDQMDELSSNININTTLLDNIDKFKSKPIIKNIERYSTLYWSSYILVPSVALLVSTLSVYFY